MISDNNILVFEPKECGLDKFEQIKSQMNYYYTGYRGRSIDSKYWISFDIDSLDASAFRSTGTAEGGGLTIEFVKKIFENFTPRSIGMDLSEVNFELTDGQARKTDE